MAGAEEAVAEIASPFVDESIWTEAVGDLTVRGGTTRDGRVLYTDQTPIGDKMSIRFSHLLKTIDPIITKIWKSYTGSHTNSNKNWRGIRII
jgi:hypothetical protein